MARKELILDPATLDFDHPIATIEEIRRLNPQRHEMEQLTAIVYVNEESKTVAGYKDITQNEFWARGHMPGMPIMPGVILCEAAAQLCSYLTQKYDLIGAPMLGFGGMDNVRFREPVCPGDRLVIVAQLTKLRRGALIVSRFQGFVRDALVVEGEIKGIPLPVEMTPSGPRLLEGAVRSR